MTLEAHVERRIATRRCTRREWHALRRYRRYQQEGLEPLDLELAGAVLHAAYREAFMPWVRALSRLLDHLGRLRA